MQNIIFTPYNCLNIHIMRDGVELFTFRGHHTIIWICPSVRLSVRLFHISSAVYGPICSQSPPWMYPWWSYYKMAISLYAWESGWEPHWQGDSIEKYEIVGNILEVIKTECLADWPRVEKFPIAIQFLATHVIVMGVSNYGNEASLWTCSSLIYKTSHLRVWMLKFW